MLIPRRAFGVRKIAAKDQTRWALTALRLERDPDGLPWGIASDGKRLLAYSWPEPDADDFPQPPGEPNDSEQRPGFSVLLPVRDAAEVERAVPRKTFRPELAHAHLTEAVNGTARLVTTDCESAREFRPRPVDASFPEWRSVVPSYSDEDAVSILVNPYMLAELLKIAADAAANPRAVAARITIPKDAKSGIRIDVESEDYGKAVGVLMPLDPDAD